jgi:signal transduction histidine kinase
MSSILLDSEAPGRSSAPRRGPADALRLDRERIARDLHDHVIQRLFAAGLATERVAQGLTGDNSSSLKHVVAELDDTMREIRAMVYDLAGPLGPERGSVSARLESVAAGLAGVLGFEPTMHVHGFVDQVPEQLVPDLVAVVREGLMNAARHAGAHAVDVKVVATLEAVLVRLRDDGVGLGEAVRTSGLDNLRARAERAGGSMQIASGSGNIATGTGPGTRLLWSVPLT